MDVEDPYECLPPTTTTATHMLAGAAAGVMEHCVFYPVDCVKVRGYYGFVVNLLLELLCYRNQAKIFVSFGCIMKILGSDYHDRHDLPGHDSHVWVTLTLKVYKIRTEEDSFSLTLSKP